MTKIYTFEYNDKIDGYECIDHPMAAGGEFVRLDEYDTLGRQLTAQEDALGSCREAFEGLEAALRQAQDTADGLRAALKPFSDLWRDSLADKPDDTPTYGFNDVVITVGQIREARRVVDNQTT